MEAIQTRICEDCQKELEVLEPRCKAEIRCISCQVQYRITGKSAHQRYIEELKKQQEETNAPN